MSAIGFHLQMKALREGADLGFQYLSDMDNVNLRDHAVGSLERQERDLHTQLYFMEMEVLGTFISLAGMGGFFYWLGYTGRMEAEGKEKQAMAINGKSMVIPKEESS